MIIRGPVLAAIDLADSADEVLEQASAMAKRLKARLIVLHVLPELLQVRMLFPQYAGIDDKMSTTIEQKARDAVSDRVQMVTNRLESEFELIVDSGSIHAEILDYAERMDAGLIVVGPGVVADRVARYAPCAVLVARPSKSGSVLAATDFSDPSLPAIEVAGEEAARRGSSLRLLYCLEAGEPIVLGSATIAIGVLPLLPTETTDALENECRERLRAALARFGISGECIVKPQRPAPGIVAAASEVPTELIVIGLRGRSNISRLVLGSVAEAVLQTAPCSVLVVHLAAQPT